MFADRQLTYLVMWGLCAIGCSKAAKSPGTPKPVSETVGQSEAVRSPAPLESPLNGVKPKAKVRLDEGFEIPRAYQTESLETLFSRILSRGFRTPTKSANLSRERCVRAMQAVVSRGHTSVSFLEAKLNQGSLSEKALAMWLIGSMGPYAKKLARDVGYGMSHSWTVPIKRCTKSGKGEPECRRKVFGNVPSWTVKAGCRALRNLGSFKSVSNTAALGLSQEMMVPCLPAFTQYLGDGTIRDKLIESWSLKPVRTHVLNVLETQPKAALSFAVYWLHALHFETEIDNCPLETVLGPPTSALVSKLKGRLQSQELGALIELKSSSKSQKARQCIVKYLEAFGAYDPALSPLPSRPRPEEPNLTQFFEVGEFCPADQE